MVGLFINKKDLKRYTILDGNIDENLYLPIIEVAQEQHIQKLLGSDLYIKIRGLVESSTLSDVANVDYKLLVDNFINKATVFYTMVDLIPVISYNASNNGLGKKVSENIENATKDEINDLISLYRDKAEHYSNLCRKYICENISKYPEYNTNNAEDIYPETKTFSTNWEI